MEFPSARASPVLLVAGTSVATGASVGCGCASGACVGVGCGASVTAAAGSGVTVSGICVVSGSAVATFSDAIPVSGVSAEACSELCASVVTAANSLFSVVLS